ncbi:Lrp/AsnC family transcriptional regulator [Streptomyces sp. NPDC048290]|uniref:Lrp/AsnC family transcriptional regulator n=1 Tax=Streptomyces sp. NPDC048290 TaxID=3155811 RepID=UPI00341C7E4B
MRGVDRTGARILLALDDDPLATTVALADKLGLARNTVQNRQRRMESDGTLAAPSVRVRADRLGRPVLAFVTLEIGQVEGRRTLREISAVPEVCEVHAITGGADLLVRVVARDSEDLYRVTRALLSCSGVVRSNTMLSMVEVVRLRMAPLLRETAESDE